MRKLSVGVLFFTLIGLAGLNAQEAAETTEAPAENTALKKKAADNNELKAKVDTALDKEKEWMVYKRDKGVARLKHFAAPTYYVPKEGDVFKVAIVNGKHYVRLKNGALFEEHWENETGFQNNFSPYPLFTKNLDKKIGDLNIKLQKQKATKERVEGYIEKGKEQYKSINNWLSNAKRHKRSAAAQERINHAEQNLNKIKNTLEEREKFIKDLKKEMRDEDQSLTEMKRLRQKYAEDPNK